MPVVPVPEHSPGPVLGAELPGVRRLLALPAQEVVRELGLGTRLEEPGLGPLQVPALVLPPAPAPAPGLVPGVGGGGDGLGLRPPRLPRPPHLDPQQDRHRHRGEDQVRPETGDGQVPGLSTYVEGSEQVCLPS